MNIFKCRLFGFSALDIKPTGGAGFSGASFRKGGCRMPVLVLARASVLTLGVPWVIQNDILRDASEDGSIVSNVCTLTMCLASGGLMYLISPPGPPGSPVIGHYSHR